MINSKFNCNCCEVTVNYIISLCFVMYIYAVSILRAGFLGYGIGYVAGFGDQLLVYMTALLLSSVLMS